MILSEKLQGTDNVHVQRNWEATGARPKERVEIARKIFLNDFSNSDDEEVEPAEILLRERVRTIVAGVDKDRIEETAIRTTPEGYEFPKSSDDIRGEQVRPSEVELGKNTQPVAFTQSENRSFFKVNLNGKIFVALYDTGIMMSIVGKMGAQCYAKGVRQRAVEASGQFRSAHGGRWQAG